MPGPPCTTSTLLCSERMIASCSLWMVSTMSVMCPVRAALSAASSALSLPTPPSDSTIPARCAASRSRYSSLIAVTERLRVRMCLRRVTPSGAAVVAR
ncbi:Uncharacterised protein [Mycobacteroides abscessus subsp. abscessus]|nr:Uncharacterised protein [Mycobacteroides abscessus subsp. abscessus]